MGPVRDVRNGGRIVRRPITAYIPTGGVYVRGCITVPGHWTPSKTASMQLALATNAVSVDHVA